MTEKYSRGIASMQTGEGEFVDLFPGNAMFVSGKISKFFEAYMGKPIVRDEYQKGWGEMLVNIFDLPAFSVSTIFRNGNIGFAFYMNVKGKDQKSLTLYKNPVINRRHVVRSAQESLSLNFSTTQLGSLNFPSGTFAYKNGNKDSIGVTDQKENIERLYNEFCSFVPTRARFRP